MRFVVLGAGAVGGTVAAKLHRAGHDATLVARGAHASAIARNGLRLESPEETEVLDVKLAASLEDLFWTGVSAALLCVHSQHTLSVVERLAATAPPTAAVVCLQNGIANEATVARLFRNVYGAYVAFAASRPAPGTVQLWTTPAGVVDVGPWLPGHGDEHLPVTSALRDAGFDARARAIVMPWKRRKLLSNLVNALEVITGPDAVPPHVERALVTEGEAVFAAAGLPVVSRRSERRRLTGTYHAGTIADRRRSGSSTWQSVERSAPSLETPFLNGEIVRLGRRHRVPTPANRLVQTLAIQCASGLRRPAGTSWESLDGLLQAARTHD